MKTPPRLTDFDYSQAGAYFLTICSRQRACLFGEIVDYKVRLSKVGELISNNWLELRERYPYIDLDAYVVMPNHFHGILWLNSKNVERKSLSRIVAGFKATSTSRAQGFGTLNGRIWQPNFYEHVIRSDRELFNVREYIANNPANWQIDPENTSFTSESGQPFDKYAQVFAPSITARRE